MIVTFGIVHNLRPEEIIWSQWHTWVRMGLIKAAKWLIEVNLRKGKWEKNAPSKYGFVTRTRAYNIRKQKAVVRDPETGIYVEPRQPQPRDLSYLGFLEDSLKGKPPEQYNIDARSTQNVIRVRVPIPTPHRMQSLQYDELSDWTLMEYVGMRRILVAEVARLAGISGSVGNLERRAKYNAA